MHLKTWKERIAENRETGLFFIQKMSRLIVPLEKCHCRLVPLDGSDISGTLIHSFRWPRSAVRSDCK